MEMQKYIIAFSVLVFTWTTQGNSQSQITISTPEMTLNENNLEIRFDIINTAPEQKFDVKIEITDTEGKMIQARSLSGDIGSGIPGGRDKVINWNLTADNITMDADLFFQVLAELSRDVDDPEYIESLIKMAESNARPELTRKNIILQSLLFPGLGLSKQNPGKPHWLKGVAGYSCVVGSIGFISLSKINENRQDQGQEYYEKSIQQWYVSQGLMYAAIGIWATDLVWNIAATKNLKNETSYYPPKGISIHTSYHPPSRSPLLGLTYNF